LSTASSSSSGQKIKRENAKYAKAYQPKQLKGKGINEPKKANVDGSIPSFSCIH